MFPSSKEDDLYLKVLPNKRRIDGKRGGKDNVGEAKGGKIKKRKLKEENVLGIDIVAKSGNLTPKITDHMPNFLLLQKKLYKETKRHLMKRNFTKFDE